MTIQITNELPGGRRPYLGDVVSRWAGSRVSARRCADENKGTLPQEANKVPSGLNLTEDMDMVCPESVCLSS